MKKTINEILKSLPKNPGVYFFKDNKNTIIYIGKAKNLYKRVSSYFNKNQLDFKTKSMLPNIKTIDFLITNSEEESLLWENTLIKRFKPKYNIMLKDDKTYPYLKITNEKFPTITITRKIDDDTADYFGPYVDSGNLKQIVQLIKKIFKIRKCKKNLNKPAQRPCLNYFMNKCLAPCMHKIDEKIYKKMLADIKLFIQSKYKILKNKWQKEINKYIKNLEFEKAEIIKQRILILNKLDNFDIKIWEINKNYIEKLSKIYQSKEKDKNLTNLENLLKLPTKIKTIAGFDISTLQGRDSVGSRVVFVDGKPEKTKYRKYKIKTINNNKPDDFAMMKELLTRTLQAEDIDEIDLFIIDGGKGQLNIANQAMKIAKKNIPIISIAKKQEILFIPNQSNGIQLAQDSETLKLIRYIRDEAHRFAINYHKKLRKKRFKYISLLSY